MLSDQLLAEYQQIHEQEFGNKISKEDALEGGLRLVQLLKITTNVNQNYYGKERKE